MALTSDLTFTVECSQTNPIDLGTPIYPLSVFNRVRLTSGTGVDQADLLWTDTRTLAASATEDLDLSGGSLTDAYNTALTFARIKALYVTAAAANTNNVNIYQPTSVGVPLFLTSGGGIPVRPGGGFMWVAPNATGIVVTNSTGDILRLANSSSGTSVTYSIAIIGASA